METFSLFIHFVHSFLFLSYLWGMETLQNLLPTVPKLAYVLILPMRNGNFIIVLAIAFLSVLILPMRNGNLLEFALQYSKPSFVLILPMRNGNNSIISMILHIHSRSYPTYEEWKLVKASIHNFTLNVLILPMRNGNTPVSQILKISCQFLSYLWGMETYSDQIVTPSFLKVLILPMRNGNFDTSDTAFESNLVLILPMRNGNLYILFFNIAYWPFLSYLWGMETRWLRN